MIIKIFSLVLFAGLFTIQFASAQDTRGGSLEQQQFKKLMKKKNTYVVDVSTPEEYKGGFIGNEVK